MAIRIIFFSLSNFELIWIESNQVLRRVQSSRVKWIAYFFHFATFPLGSESLGGISENQRRLGLDRANKHNNWTDDWVMARKKESYHKRNNGAIEKCQIWNCFCFILHCILPSAPSGIASLSFLLFSPFSISPGSPKIHWNHNATSKIKQTSKQINKIWWSCWYECAITVAIK